MFNGVYCICAVHDVLLLFFMLFVNLCAYVDGGKKTNIKYTYFQN